MAQPAGAPSVTVPEEPPPLPHSSSSSSSSSSSNGDSGHVSQSHSSASGIGDEHAGTGDASRGEFLLAAAAADYASYLLPSPLENVASAGQIGTLDKSLEDLLIRVDEFVGMLDMIRNDSSQVINESVPHIHAKAMEMKKLYRKIDKLEAFVKMIGNNVAGMEEQIIKAESDLGNFPNTLKKLLYTINVPSFLNSLPLNNTKRNLEDNKLSASVVLQRRGLDMHARFIHHVPYYSVYKAIQKSSSSRQNQALYEPLDLFKTEDYFPCLDQGQCM